MSHIVVVETKVHDKDAVRAACRRLALAPPVYGNHKMFSGEVTGFGVQLPRWRYPAVAKLDTGEFCFDNYLGRWGEQKELDRFLQSYAIEKTSIEARRRGHSLTETPLADGSVKLTIHVGGAA